MPGLPGWVSVAHDLEESATYGSANCRLLQAGEMPLGGFHSYKRRAYRLCLTLIASLELDSSVATCFQ
jgi:hypothetical protein